MSCAVHRPQDARRRRALLRVLEGEGRVRRCPRRTLQLTRSEAPPGRVCGACHRTPRDPLLRRPRRPGTAHAGHARAQRPPPRRGPPRSTRLTRGPAVGRCRFGRPSSMRQGRPTARGNASAKISAVSSVVGGPAPSGCSATGRRRRWNTRGPLICWSRGTIGRSRMRPAAISLVSRRPTPSSRRGRQRSCRACTTDRIAGTGEGVGEHGRQRPRFTLRGVGHEAIDPADGLRQIPMNPAAPFTPPTGSSPGQSRS